MSEPADGDGSKSKPGEGDGKPEAAEESAKVEDKAQAAPPKTKVDAKAEATATDDGMPEAKAVKVGKVGSKVGEKSDAVSGRKLKVATKPSDFVSSAEYVKGYEKHVGKLELKGGKLLFRTPKGDLAGKVALGGILALALDRFEDLVTVPVNDILGISTPTAKGTLEIETPKETLTFIVEDREEWAKAFAGELGEPAADPFHAEISYPDDGALSAGVRRIDNALGVLEQIVLVAMLAAVTLTAAAHAILERVAHVGIPFKTDVIHGGTFAIALIGAVFATHQAKHLSMDLISRKLSPRNRLFLKVALSLFMFFIVALMIRAGFHTITIEEGMATRDKVISSVRLAWLIPIGGFLIMLHTFLHTIIDIDYIARRKTPPERMRSGH